MRGLETAPDTQVSVSVHPSFTTCTHWWLPGKRAPELQLPGGRSGSGRPEPGAAQERRAEVTLEELHFPGPLGGGEALWRPAGMTFPRTLKTRRKFRVLTPQKLYSGSDLGSRWRRNYNSPNSASAGTTIPIRPQRKLPGTPLAPELQFPEGRSGSAQLRRPFGTAFPGKVS